MTSGKLHEALVTTVSLERLIQLVSNIAISTKIKHPERPQGVLLEDPVSYGLDDLVIRKEGKKTGET